MGASVPLILSYIVLQSQHWALWIRDHAMRYICAVLFELETPMTKTGLGWDPCTQKSTSKGETLGNGGSD